MIIYICKPQQQIERFTFYRKFDKNIYRYSRDYYINDAVSTDFEENVENYGSNKQHQFESQDQVLMPLKNNSNNSNIGVKCKDIETENFACESNVSSPFGGNRCEVKKYSKINRMSTNEGSQWMTTMLSSGPIRRCSSLRSLEMNNNIKNLANYCCNPLLQKSLTNIVDQTNSRPSASISSYGPFARQKVMSSPPELEPYKQQQTLYTSTHKNQHHYYHHAPSQQQQQQIMANNLLSRHHQHQAQTQHQRAIHRNLSPHSLDFCQSSYNHNQQNRQSQAYSGSGRQTPRSNYFLAPEEKEDYLYEYDDLHSERSWDRGSSGTEGIRSSHSWINLMPLKRRTASLLSVASSNGNANGPTGSGFQAQHPYYQHPSQLNQTAMKHSVRKELVAGNHSNSNSSSHSLLSQFEKQLLHKDLKRNSFRAVSGTTKDFVINPVFERDQFYNGDEEQIEGEYRNDHHDDNNYDNYDQNRWHSHSGHKADIKDDISDPNYGFTNGGNNHNGHYYDYYNEQDKSNCNGEHNNKQDVDAVDKNNGHLHVNGKTKHDDNNDCDHNEDIKEIDACFKWTLTYDGDALTF